MQSLGDAGPAPGSRSDGSLPLRWQIDQEDVHGTGLEECAGHCQAFVEVVRSENHEPLELDPARDCLDWIQAPGEIHVGDDPAGRLGLRGKS
jgi:hypothetical protein